jgi:hypothetical protein
MPICGQEFGRLIIVGVVGQCKLWDDDPEKSIYHCNDCGICRIGQGLGKDFFHCKVGCFLSPSSSWFLPTYNGLEMRSLHVNSS